MRNPLNKRFGKELKSEFVKYFIIFIFMAGLIGAVSGFMVANHSMTVAYEESFDKYHIEGGNFSLAEKADAEVLEQLEAEGVVLYENFYYEEKTKEVDSSLRVFTNRKEINQPSLIEGKMPESKNQIAIDRMYADNNELAVGDALTVSDIRYEICGLLALPDYSALYQNPSDMMFDAMKFGVAYVSPEGFDRLNDYKEIYSYSYQYLQQPKDQVEAKEKADDFLAVLRDVAVITNFIPEYSNQAIHFVADDITKDNMLFQVFLYLVVAIIAFVFAITTSNSITKEANVIGTLRASGYSRGEMIRHYLAMPILVLIVAGIVGNLLGYTIFKDYMVEMYYNSYSLPAYQTLWNANAFLKTTIIPFLIMFGINYIMLSRKLRLSPLKFIRRDLSHNKRKKAVHLNKNRSFFHRFRLRILFQNLPNYVMVLVGTFCAVLIMLFGVVMSPVMDHYEEEITQNMLSRYQYILKTPMMTANTEAEQYCVTKLMTEDGRYKSEEAMIYGIEDNSSYCDLSLQEEGVLISSAYAGKFHVKKGDVITLQEEFGTKTYDFLVRGTYDYPSTIAVFMNRDDFCKVFNQKEGYFNGYFSNEEITDLDPLLITTVITEDDLTKTSRQMRISMNDIMRLFQVFGAVMFALIIYLLSKLIIERNSQSISMVKILGYSNREINALYILCTSAIVMLSVLVSLPLANLLIEKLFLLVFVSYPGWITYVVPARIFAETGILAFVLYCLVAMLQMRRVKKIAMTDALKNVE